MTPLYQVTISELRFILNFAEIAPASWSEESLIMSEEEVLSCLASLQEKGYLHERQQGEYDLDPGINFILALSKDATYTFSLEGLQGQKETVFFFRDAISVILQEGDSAELMWLPSLPLLIGHLANVFSPFKNHVSNSPTVFPLSDYEKLITEFLENGYQLQWTFVSGGRQPSGDHGCILDNDREQILLITDGDQCIQSRPGKADLVNSIAKIVAHLHAFAIKEGGVIDG